MLLGWGARARSGAAVESEHVLPTKVLGRFFEAMAPRPAPAILDLGAAVGSNVTYLGERLHCRLTVLDLFEDLERLASTGHLDQLPATLAERFPREEASIDGILCWDLFDYLDKPAAAALGREIVRILRPGGALMAFFSAAKGDAQPHFTRFAIQDDKTLSHRHYRGSCRKLTVLTYRDIELLLKGLKVSASFLLLNHTREILFRK
jgi:hypothetical protein